MPSALIFIADGTEEMEFTIAYDTLTRGGIECTSVLVYPNHSESDNLPGQTAATCSRGVKIIPDTSLPNLDDTLENDIFVVPGGAAGAETISKNAKVQELIRNHYGKGKLVGMICAGSLAALTSRLPRQPLTSHPSVKDDLSRAFDYKEDSVVVSGNLVTSRGPGTAFPFALKIVELIQGRAKREEIENPMVFPYKAL